MTVAFFESAFASEVPVVKDFPAPRRDFDDDGIDDDADSAPLDPTAP